MTEELPDCSGEMWSAKYRDYDNLAALDVSDVDNRLRFLGQYFDAKTGLSYNHHRYYNPGTGRLLTPDPMKFAGGLNSYQYVPNPTGWVDPLGLVCKQTNGATPKKPPQKTTPPEVGETLKFEHFEQARNKALEWLESNGFKAEKPTIGKFGTNAGKVVGMQTADGKTGYRIEYDERSGANINV
ncbi:RHS repeat-associated core domain-containing protein [Pseudomonas atacamensis]|uniref:RHS repeat-associated core domain-containing protein n=1 Tax=Pseudomonas atacamensis TaxID=2565368 RepID=UPI0035D0DD84